MEKSLLEQMTIEQFRQNLALLKAEEIEMPKKWVLELLNTIEALQQENKQLREIAKAKAEGRLAILPLKVGDTVYEPFVGKVYEKTVDRIIINRFTTPQIWIETKLPFATPRLERWDLAIGKTVFLTHEEAEKALDVGE
mgnify:CR=1 FL=1